MNFVKGGKRKGMEENLKLPLNSMCRFQQLARRFLSHNILLLNRSWTNFQKKCWVGLAMPKLHSRNIPNAPQLALSCVIYNASNLIHKICRLSSPNLCTILLPDRHENNLCIWVTKFAFTSPILPCFPTKRMFLLSYISLPQVQPTTCLRLFFPPLHRYANPLP